MCGSTPGSSKRPFVPKVRKLKLKRSKARQIEIGKELRSSGKGSHRLSKQAERFKIECKELRRTIEKAEKTYKRSAHVWPLQKAAKSYAEKLLKTEVQDGQCLLALLEKWRPTTAPRLA